MMPMEKEGKALLRATRKQLLTYGWRRYAMQDDQGRCCLLGALYKAASCPTYMAIYSVPGLRAAISLLGFDHYTDLMVWNDRDRRRKHEIFERIDKALEKK